MKSKIGIITFHKACNYGAVLQTYALQEELKKIFPEYEVKIIDYYCPAIEDRTSPFFFIKDGNIIKNVLRYIYLFIPKYRKFKCFSKFRNKYLSETLIRYNSDNVDLLNNEFLAIFTGSDQVWNLNATKEDENYFLKGIKKDTYKCSYAASFGFEEVVKTYYDKILSLVKDFDYISLRENIGVKELFEKNNIKIHVNVDPTMLLKNTDWDHVVCDNKNLVNGEYILLYCVLKTKRLVDYAKKLSERTGLPVYSISNHSDYSAFKQLRDCGVEDFLSLIKNAKYVVTTSFHGTVFSIIYHKNFVTEIDTFSSKNTRVENLLNILNIKDRIIENNSFDIDNKIEWENVDSKLQTCIEDSENYLYTIKRTVEGEN